MNRWLGSGTERRSNRCRFSMRNSSLTGLSTSSGGQEGVVLLVPSEAAVGEALAEPWSDCLLVLAVNRHKENSISRYIDFWT